jgi:enhancing lycopene biosynthesis protein 2
VDVVELAKALLGEQSPADFLETGEPIVANYTATVSYKNAEIELAGTLTFRVVGTKAGFLGKLAEEVEKIDVADVVLEGANIIVTFPEDVEVSAVAQAAADLVAALRQYAGDDSTLIVNGKTFTLGNVDVVELAKALLGDQSPADFLETGEPIVANYTATVSYKNAVIELAGQLTFKVEGTKAGFLGKLAEEVEKIDVADVVLEGANIIVTFPEDVEVTAVAQAAAGLVEALLQYAGDDSTLIVNGKTFTLGECGCSGAG